MKEADSPKVFWDFCIERRGRIHNITAKSSFKLHGPNQQEVLGRVLGPVRGEGNEMCQWALKGNGKVVPRRSVRSLNDAEIHSLMEIEKRKVL